MIMHRVINHVRLDLLEYFLFSSELTKHCEIDYKYEYFGDGAAFMYACGQGAANVVDFILNDERVNCKFDFRKISNRAITEVFDGGYFNILEILMKHPKTQDFCQKEKWNVKKLINITENRKRENFIKDLILNLDDIDLVEDIFGGSNTTGYVCELEKRRWMDFEERKDYLSASVFRFMQDKPIEEIKAVFNKLMNEDEKTTKH